MGRPKLKKNNRKKTKHTDSIDNEVKVNRKGKNEDLKDVKQLLEKAEESFDTFQYEDAQKYCQRALELEPDNIQALELISSLLLEVQEFDAAIQCLGRAVFLSPDVGCEKYMTLGQLHQNKEALQYYLKGIEILSKEIEDEKKSQTLEASNLSAKTSEKNLIRKLSIAYCSVAELFMTDLCFEENAESECKHYLEKSVDVDATNAEALQSFAGFYLVKEEPDKARELMKTSLALWLPQYQAVREGKATAADNIEVCSLSYPVRISAAKSLIELQEFEDSSLILEGLVEEDDQVIEVWYLLGWMNYLKGSDYKANAQFYFRKCIEISKKVENSEEEILNHVNELLKEIGPVTEIPDEDDEEKENEAMNNDDDDEEDEIMES